MRTRSHAAREAAYVEYVSARQPTLRRLAYVLTGDWQQADDIVRTALTRLYVAWPRLEREGTEEAFVRRLVVHSGLRTTPAPNDHARPPRDPLLAALLALPVRQRAVLVLRHWLDLTEEQVAEDLGLSVSSVQTHLAHAEAAMPADVATTAPEEVR